MPLIGVIFIIIVFAGLMSLAFHAFPGWASRHLRSGLNTATHFAFLYALTAGIAGTITLLLVMLAISIGTPWLTGLVFLWAVAYVYLVAFVPGFVRMLASLLLSLLHVNDVKLPPVIYTPRVRSFAAWVAFIGLLGVIYPSLFTFMSFIIAGLLGAIFFSVAGNLAKSDKALVICTITIVLLATFQWAAPDFYRAINRQFSARGKQMSTGFDRSSINTESNAMVTYGKLNRDVFVLYKAKMANGEDGEEIIQKLTPVTATLKTDTLLKIFNHKHEVLSFEGQGFIEVQLPKAEGSFVGGARYFVESDYIDLVTPEERKIMRSNQEPKTESLPRQIVSFSPVRRNASRGEIIFSSYGIGVHPLNLQCNESKWVSIDGCYNYNFNRDATLTVKTLDGRIAKSWEPGTWPTAKRFLVTNVGETDVTLIVN